LANMVVSPQAIHPAYDPRSEAARIPHRAAGGNLRYARWQMFGPQIPLAPYECRRWEQRKV
jgi:hypothetical protein